MRPGIQTDAPGLQHIHKKPGDLDLYLIRSRLPDSRMARVRLPIADRQARWLDTWTGKVSSLAVEHDGHGTTVELPLAPYGSAYVLLGSEPDLPAVNDHQSLSAVRASIKGKLITSLTDGWSMKFVSAVPDDAQPERFMSKITLVIGRIAKISKILPEPEPTEIHSTGKEAKVRWCSTWAGLRHRRRPCKWTEMPPMLIYPFAADITEILKEGVNELEVSVTNTLRNGMIGQGLFRGPRGRALSGLIGPVRLLRHEDTVKG